MDVGLADVAPDGEVGEAQNHAVAGGSAVIQHVAGPVPAAAYLAPHG